MPAEHQRAEMAAEHQRAEMAAEHQRQLLVAQNQQRAVEEELAAREIQALRAQLEEQRIAALSEARAQAQSLQASAAIERDARQLLAGLRAEKDTEWQAKYEQLARMYSVVAAERDTALAERDHLAIQLEDARNREESTRRLHCSVMARRANKRLLEACMQSFWSMVLTAKRLRRAGMQRRIRLKSAGFWTWYYATQRDRMLHRLEKRCERRSLRERWQAWVSVSRRGALIRHDEDWEARMGAVHTHMAGELLRRRFHKVLLACLWTWRRKSTLTRLLGRHLRRTEAARFSQMLCQWRVQAGRWKRRKLASIQCLWIPKARVLLCWREAVRTERALRHIGGLIAASRMHRLLSISLKEWARFIMLQRRRRRKYIVILLTLAE